MPCFFLVGRMNPLRRCWSALWRCPLIALGHVLMLFLAFQYWRGATPYLRDDEFAPEVAPVESTPSVASEAMRGAPAVADFGVAGQLHAVVREHAEAVLVLIAVLVLLLMALLVFFGLFLVRAKNAEQALLGELQAARENNARKTSHVATVAHELRTPLNGLIGFSELIEVSDDLEEAKRYAGFIHSSSLYLQSLLNNILDLSKIRAGRMRPTLRPCQPAALLEHATSIFRLVALRKGLVLNVHCPDRLGASLLTDPDLLERALVNLVSNAVKYTDKGSVICELREDADGWHFMVKDTGRGIGPLQLQHIFEPFNSLNEESAGSLEQSSSGLGLALTQEVATLLGARLSVSSEPGRGSTFTLSLCERHASAGS